MPRGDVHIVLGSLHEIIRVRSIEFVHQVTDPYLNLFRRFLPPLGGGRMAIDISPIIAIFVLLILQGVVVGLIDPG